MLEGCGRHCGGLIILATAWILLIERCHENKVGCSLLFVCFVLFTFGTFLFLFDTRKFRVKDLPATP